MDTRAPCAVELKGRSSESHQACLNGRVETDLDKVKYNKRSDAALDQIKRKKYAVAFAGDPRPVFAIGLNFNPDTHTLDDDWRVESLQRQTEQCHNK